MNYDKIWTVLFGTNEWLGVDAAFWIAMIIVTLIVIAMNVVFWAMPAKKR